MSYAKTSLVIYCNFLKNNGSFEEQHQTSDMDFELYVGTTHGEFSLEATANLLAQIYHVARCVLNKCNIRCSMQFITSQLAVRLIFI